jgi:polysaccharide pyruvyl transferase CsaB
MIKLIIAGYYGFRNAGDEAILSGMVHSLRSTFEDVNICVVTADPDFTKRTHEVEVVDMEDVPELIHQIRTSDAVLLGGGGLLNDYWSLKEDFLLTSKHVGLALYSGIVLLAYLLERPAMLYAVGIGPLKDEETKEVVRWIASMAKRISVRDPESAELLASMGFGEVRGPNFIRVSADPAFVMPVGDIDQARTIVKKAGIPRDGLLLAAILRYWEYGVDPDWWQQQVAAALDTWLDQNQGHVVFLPMQSLEGTLYENDLLICEKVIQKMSNRGRTTVLDLSNQFSLLPGVLSLCGLTLSMRLHGIIFSLLAGTPAVGLAYDPKITSLMSIAGLEKLNLPRNEWTASLIIGALTRASQMDSPGDLRSVVSEMKANTLADANMTSELLEEDARAVDIVDSWMRKLTLAKVQESLERSDQQYTWEYRTYELSDLFLKAQDRLLELERSKRKLGENVEQYRELLGRKVKENTELQGELESVGRTLKEQLQHNEELQQQNEDSKSRIHRLEQSRDQVLIERDDLYRQLNTLRDTLAVRITSRYWDLAKRIFPLGSRRRRLYQIVRLWFREKIKSPQGLPGGRHTEAPGASMPGWQDRNGRTAYAQGGELQSRSSILHFTEDQIRLGHRRVVTVISSTPYVESEGQRAIHLAREFSRMGYAIVFAYWRWDMGSKQPQDRLVDGVFQLPIDEMVDSPADVIHALSAFAEKNVLIEFPFPGLFEFLAMAHAEGWVTIYDVVDDWEAFYQVGQAAWYDPRFEKHLLETSDAVMAINEHLLLKIQSSGRMECAIIPNGVNHSFGRIDDPIVMDKGAITLGYFGYLAPAWFDWPLIREVASLNPEWKIYIIGYGDEGNASSLPENVVFLGKKPWRSLAAYAANWDVGIVPFRIGAVSKAADPIKTYEYLSLGLPVVTMGVDPPVGGEDFVLQSASLESFIENVHSAASSPKSLVEDRKAFARVSDWSKRAAAIESIIERGEQRILEKRSLFCRPA